MKLLRLRRVWKIMTIKRLSDKQRLTVNWWLNPKLSRYDAIICDGAVRSGKTMSMSLGFVIWAVSSFNGGAFAICGKTVNSLRRNVITPIIPVLRDIGMLCEEKISRSFMDVTYCGRKNRFYFFGGRDESSAALIQGVTLSGVFLDETALMPRSFVEQALARCSVNGSKMWFNCNPDTPSHWFYNEWIRKAESKNALYLHFTMDDNPSLSEELKNRYKRLYSGAFYDRFVLGKWTASKGIVYPMFDPEKHVFDHEPFCERYIISCDYGTVNPTSMGLWGYSDGIWYRLREYYYASKKEGVCRTDEEHYAALEELAGGKKIEKIIIDPSAASFIECVKRHGKFRTVKADNDVVTGIRRAGSVLKEGRLMFHRSCSGIITEFSLYRWSDKTGSDAPIKDNDHAMDDMRYFVSEVFKSGGDSFFALSVERKI